AEKVALTWWMVETVGGRTARSEPIRADQKRELVLEGAVTAAGWAATQISSSAPVRWRRDPSAYIAARWTASMNSDPDIFRSLCAHGRHHSRPGVARKGPGAPGSGGCRMEAGPRHREQKQLHLRPRSEPPWRGPREGAPGSGLRAQGSPRAPNGAGIRRRPAGRSS